MLGHRGRVGHRRPNRQRRLQVLEWTARILLRTERHLRFVPAGGGHTGTTRRHARAEGGTRTRNPGCRGGNGIARHRHPGNRSRTRQPCTGEAGHRSRTRRPGTGEPGDRTGRSRTPEPGLRAGHTRACEAGHRVGRSPTREAGHRDGGDRRETRIRRTGRRNSRDRSRETTGRVRRSIRVGGCRRRRRVPGRQAARAGAARRAYRQAARPDRWLGSGPWRTESASGTAHRRGRRANRRNRCNRRGDRRRDRRRPSSQRRRAKRSGRSYGSRRDRCVGCGRDSTGWNRLGLVGRATDRAVTTGSARGKSRRTQLLNLRGTARLAAGTTGRQSQIASGELGDEPGRQVALDRQTRVDRKPPLKVRPGVGELGIRHTPGRPRVVRQTRPQGGVRREGQHMGATTGAPRAPAHRRQAGQNVSGDR